MQIPIFGEQPLPYVVRAPPQMHAKSPLEFGWPFPIYDFFGGLLVCVKHKNFAQARQVWSFGCHHRGSLGFFAAPKFRVYFGRFCVLRQDWQWRLVVGLEGVLRRVVANGAQWRSTMAMKLGSKITMLRSTSQVGVVWARVKELQEGLLRYQGQRKRTFNPRKRGS
jgi:hypothetical protein